MSRRSKEERRLLRGMFVRNVPETTRQIFRASCVAAGFTMQDVLINVMKYLDKPAKVKEFMD